MTATPRDAARPVLIGTVLVALFTFFFVFPGHDPKPNHLPVGLAVPDARAQAAALERDGRFEVHVYADAGAARAAMLDREIYAALAAGPDGARLLLAPAASFPVAQLAGDVLAQGRPVTREVVRALDPDDPRGVSLNLLVLPLSITAILAALLAFQLAPALPPRVRLAALAVFAILGALAAIAIVRLGIGALPGPFLGLVGIVALGLGATSVAAAAIMQAIGPPGVGLAFLVFLMIGNPASGAASAPELLPDPWRVGGQFLPGGAAAGAVRNVAYFDGAALGRPLAVLAVWAAVGALVLIVTGRRRAVQAPT